MTAVPTSTESSLSHIVPIFMRVALFSLIDDWEVGPRMAENGHEIVAWIKPAWAPDKARPPIVRRAARLARVLASQAKPPTSVPRIYNAAEWIDRLGIERVSCASVNDPEFVSRLQAMRVDLAIVAVYPQIFKSAILAVPKLGVVNYHPSLLPQYAGPQPAFWALRNGETVTGITTHWMTERIDAGDILAQDVVELDGEENLGQLMQRLHHRAASLIARTVNEIASLRVTPTPQDPSKRTYFGRKNAADTALDWARPTKSLIDLLRAVRPFAPLQTRLDDRVVNIFQARRFGGDSNGQPGEILSKRGRRLVVQAGDGSVEITSYEIEPFHGWMNAVAQRFVPRVGDRFR